MQKDIVLGGRILRNPHCRFILKQKVWPIITFPSLFKIQVFVLGKINKTGDTFDGFGCHSEGPERPIGFYLAQKERTPSITLAEGS